MHPQSFKMSSKSWIPWPEWSFLWTGVSFLTKRHENVNATPATAQLRQKVRVAAVALTLFYFCDTSNEILTKMTSESKSREVNFHSYGEKWTHHLPTCKMSNLQMLLKPLKRRTFRSHSQRTTIIWQGPGRAKWTERRPTAGRSSDPLLGGGWMITFWDESVNFCKACFCEG